MKIIRFLNSIFMLGLLMVPAVALADLGPKPGMSFKIVYQTSARPKIVSGEQLECQDDQCVDAKSLATVGPQGFYCYQNKCSSLAYGYADYHKLRIKFDDNITRESNVFKTNGFDSRYTVNVQKTDLIIPEGAVGTIPDISPNKITGFSVALLITLLVELLIALIYFVIRKINLKVLWFVFLGNLISLPIVHFVFPLLNLSSSLTTTSSEIFAVILEFALIYLCTKKHITARDTIILVIIINLVSFLIGYLI